MKNRNVQYGVLIAWVILLLVVACVLMPRAIFNFAQNRLSDHIAARQTHLLEKAASDIRQSVYQLGDSLLLAYYEATAAQDGKTDVASLEQIRQAADPLLLRSLAYLDDAREIRAIAPASLDKSIENDLKMLLRKADVSGLIRNANLTGRAQLSSDIDVFGNELPAALLFVPLKNADQADSPDLADGENAAAAKSGDKVAFMLATVDISRLLRASPIQQVSGEGQVWILDPSGLVLAHPDPAVANLPLNKVKGMSSEQAEFLRTALDLPAHSASFQHLPPAENEHIRTIASSQHIKVGDLHLVVAITQALSAQGAHLSVVVRGFIILILVLAVLMLATGHMWQRIKRREIEETTRANMSAELEKMVEARTVELNFVTRTIKDLIDSIPSALVVLDRNLNVLLVNLSFYSIFSSRLVNVTGRNITEIFSPDFGDRMRRIMHTKEPIIDLEMRKYIEGHGEKVLMVNVLHLLGKRDRLLMVIDDASERKILERQLIQAEKMSGLGTLVSGIAHEINNPLNAIAGMAQIILTRAQNDDVRSDADQILQYVKRVAEIVKELSRYSRSAKVTDAITADIHNIIEGALTMVTHSRKLKEVQLDKQFTHDLPGIKVNVIELEQVFINLITNAIDALEELAAKKGDDFKRRIAITTSLHGGEFVQIVLQDNGPGIPAENLKKIFDPFFSTKEQGKGTGLGLSISYKIIQRYGGIILVESQVDKGTKFTIRLPVNM